MARCGVHAVPNAIKAKASSAGFDGRQAGKSVRGQEHCSGAPV